MLIIVTMHPRTNLSNSDQDLVEFHTKISFWHLKCWVRHHSTFTKGCQGKPKALENHPEVVPWEIDIQFHN